MATSRAAMRVAARLSSRPRLAVSRPVTATSAAGRRGLTVMAPLWKSEAINEQEIPVSVHTPQAQADRFSIPTRPAAAANSPANPEEPEGPIVPLTRKVYASMPPTMQKMTVMDKVVLITGGARGLGNNMAQACAEAGAKALIIFDQNQELGDKAVADLHEKTALPISFFKVDVRDEAAISAAVDSVVKQYAAPNVLINSAGIADSNIKAETYDPAMWRRQIDINLTGSFLMSQAVGRALIAAGQPGSIILVASMSASIVNYPQEQSCYNASKAGVIQLGRSLAAEWAKHGIRVNTISPGYMDTALNRVPALDAQKKIWKSLTPQGRLGGVDELNGLCVFLASDASSFMTGADVRIDGGYSVY